MLEVVRVTTLHSNNVNMVASGKVLVVSPKITRVGVDNSATWFVDGMIHRQRRK